jgi:hypothetical protein
MGMASIVGDNDDNGKYLYVARVEASYPSKARDGEMDTDHIPLPNVSVGLGGMFSEKTVTTGIDYPLLTVDGKKRSLGGDFTFMYKGFTVIGEFVLYNVNFTEFSDTNINILEKELFDFFHSKNYLFDFSDLRDFYFSIFLKNQSINFYLH